MMMNRINELRAIRKISQKELADYLQVSRAALSGYETGKFEADLVTYFKLADYFGVSLDYLLGHTNSKSAVPNPGTALSANENQLIENFRRLNDEGQLTVINMLNGLIASGAYIKNSHTGQIQIS